MHGFALWLPFLAALADAWTPGARDRCNPTAVMGGSYVMPHEKYCQVFLSCDLWGNQFQTACPKPALFAFGDGVSTCSVLGSTKYTCPNWPCSLPEHIGKRYPDVCCKKYWQCTTIGNDPNLVYKFAARECATGTNFNSNLEQCQPENRQTDVCFDTTFCYPDDFVDPNANTVYDCPNSPVASDSCMYMTDGWNEPRKCPAGTAYNQQDCQCSDFAVQCSGSSLSREQLNNQKKPDATCRASGSIDFSKTPLVTNSIKLTPTNQLTNPTKVDHYYTNRSMSFSTGGANFNGAPNALLYDYYYADNILYSPLGIVLTVQFTQPNGGFASLQGTKINLLENVYWSGATKYCKDATIGIYATYQGNQGGLNQWQFSITAKGEGVSGALEATTQTTVLGGTNDFYRVGYYFNNNLSGFVRNVQQSGRGLSGTTSNFPVSTVALGSRIGTNKCGFSIGRNLNGRMIEFSVHEGCQDQNVLKQFP